MQYWSEASGLRGGNCSQLLYAQLLVLNSLASDLLFPSNTRMAQVWDYMLLTFEEAGAINKKTWSEVGKIKADEAKEVLNKVAILEPSSGWVLKVCSTA